mgnify:CR=1 FL=1
MLLKLCLLLLIFLLIYRYFYRRRDSVKKTNLTESDADHRFDISRVEEAQFRDIESSHKESESRE